VSGVANNRRHVRGGDGELASRGVHVQVEAGTAVASPCLPASAGHTTAHTALALANEDVGADGESGTLCNLLDLVLARPVQTESLEVLGVLLAEAAHLVDFNARG